MLPPLTIFRHLIPPTPTALVDVDGMGPTRPSVENGGQIELRGEACRALIRRIRNDESSTEAAWDLDDGGGLARVTCHGYGSALTPETKLLLLFLLFCPGIGRELPFN